MWLAVSTAHDACSAALIADGAVLLEAHETIGRGHDARLAPMVARLIAEAGAVPESIAVDIGPGSFTGIRVGLALAQGLALGWDVPVHGFACDRALAGCVLRDGPDVDPAGVLLDARRGEFYVRAHGRSGAEGEARALPQSEAVAWARSFARIACPPAVAATLAPSIEPARIQTHEIRAANAALLAAEDRQLPPEPLYVRAPDAKLPQ